MSGLLCLKWNNHSPAILKNISNIHIKEKYCDATIVCQGTYFPVHKIILSTCSEYFDDMFDRMQCQHPYIVFKDIEPAEIELLLNYMYHGEVNVVQEMLPSLIKVAEALKIKGLAVPDDEIFKEDSCGKKRSINTDDGPHPEPKRMDEGRRKRNSVSANASTDSGDSNIYSNIDTVTNFQNLNKTVAEYITTESLRKEFENAALPMNDPLNSPANQGSSVADVPLVNDSASCSIKKEENPYVLDSYVDQVPPSDWSDFANGGAHNVSGTEANTPNTMPDMPMPEMPPMPPGLDGPDEECPAESEDTALPSIASIYKIGSSSRDYKCQYCDYVSCRNSNVKKHIKFKHTGERPYPCFLCSKRFVEGIALKRHMRIHTGEKPFFCTLCPVKFSHKKNLKNHMARYHNTLPSQHIFSL